MKEMSNQLTKINQLSNIEKNKLLLNLKQNFKIISLQDALSSDAVYLLANGSFLDTRGPFDHNSQHINISNYLKTMFNINDTTETDGSALLENLGAIRISTWVPAIVLPTQAISEEQDESLTEFLGYLAAKGIASKENPLQIGTVANGGTEYFERAPHKSELIDNGFGFGISISLIIENYYKTHHLFENKKLKEDTRTALVTKSRNKGGYKDTSRGRNRFERKKYSKVANTVRQYNKINMNNLFKSDILQVEIPVTGETDNYTVSVKMDGVIAEIQKNIKNNKNKFEFRTVIQALTKVFNTANIYVKCTCDDYKYNYAHWNIVNNVSIDDTAHDPGPGKGIKNPKDEKGRGCKHVLLVLSNGDWLMKVASVINNYVHYAEEHLQKPFLNIIFPKLYGIPANEAVEQDLIDDDKYLDSSSGFIDAINEYGRNRGKIVKGSNKNPVAEKNKNKEVKEKES